MPSRPLGLSARAALRSRATGCSISWYASEIRTASSAPGRQAWIGSPCRARSTTCHRFLARHAPLDHLDHLRLDVLRVDPPVGADAAREPDGEPAAGGAEVSHDAAFGDVERVHDLLGALPDVAIGPLELAEVLGREQLAVLLPLLAGDGCPAPASRPAAFGQWVHRLVFLPCVLPSDSSGCCLLLSGRRAARRCHRFRR